MTRAIDTIHVKSSRDNSDWGKKPIRRFFNIFFKYFLPDLLIVWKNRKNPFPIYVHTRVLTPKNLGEHFFYSQYVDALNKGIRAEMAAWEKHNNEVPNEIDDDATGSK